MLIAKTLFLIGALLVHQSEGSNVITDALQNAYNKLPSASDVITTLGGIPKTLGISGKPDEALIDQKTVDGIVASLDYAAKNHLPIAKEKLYEFTQYLGKIAKSKVPIAKKSINQLTDYLADALLKLLP